MRWDSHNVRLALAASILLILLDFDCKVGDVIVDLPIARDLPHQAPIISFGHSVLEEVEIAPWPGE
jgi:hypothetical protein